MSRAYFGGKAPKPLKYTLLPYMAEYLESIKQDGEVTPYGMAIRVGLARFCIFAETENLTHPDQIERRHLIRFQTYLKTATKESGEIISTSYQQQILKALRAYLGWMKKTGYMDVNPWEGAGIKIQPNITRPDVLSGEELERLFEAHKQQAFTISPFYYHRREALLVLLAGWGLSMGEIGGVTVTSMDMRLEWVTVNGHSGRSKTLPYSEEMKLSMQRWLRVRAAKAKPGADAFLIDKEGNQLSEAMMRKILAELGQRAGVNLTVRRMRGTFGSTLLEQGVDIGQVMKMMGHSSREHTKAYRVNGDAAVKEAHNAVIDPMLNNLLKGGR